MLVLIYKYIVIFLQLTFIEMTLYHWNHYICFVLVLHLICINDLTSATWVTNIYFVLLRRVRSQTVKPLDIFNYQLSQLTVRYVCNQQKLEVKNPQSNSYSDFLANLFSSHWKKNWLLKNYLLT